MPITSPVTGTRIDEIAPGTFRISTPVAPAIIPGGFTFNQFLVVDEEPLLFHTGPRRMFPYVREAIAHVMDVSLLRWVSFSHVEADECGALNEVLAAAPRSRPVCSRIAAMVSIEDLADRPPRPLADGETIRLGAHVLRWIDVPHLPHGWDSGLFFDETTRTLFAGDLFTQPGADGAPVTDGDILGPSETFREAMDYYAGGATQRVLLEKLAALAPTTLACMHGSSFRGDGASLLRALAGALEKSTKHAA
jgi:flavorubredoxin